MSGYEEVPFPGFGGLNVRDARASAPHGSAGDLGNVTLRGGEVRTRGGTTFRSSAGAIAQGAPIGVDTARSGDRQYVIVRRASAVYSINNLGGVVSHTWPVAGDKDGLVTWVPVVGSDHIWVTARDNDPRYLHAGIGAWTVPTVSIAGAGAVSIGKPRLVCVSNDGRLLMGGYTAGANGPGGATVDPAMVYATDPYAPAAMAAASNFFRLGAADNDALTAMVSWRELTFLFTARGFTVLTGISADEDGLPRFHRRPVVGGKGTAWQRLVTSGPDGVYFMAEDGIYRTTGGPPVLVSDAVGDLFRSKTTVDTRFTGPHPAQNTTNLQYHEGMLIVNCPVTTGFGLPGQLRLDLQSGQWTCWDLPAQAWTTDVDGGLLFVDTEPGGGNDAMVWEYLGDRDRTYADFEPGAGGRRAKAGFTAWWRSTPLIYGDGLSQMMEHRLWGRIPDAGGVTLEVYENGVWVATATPRWRSLGDSQVGVVRRGHQAREHWLGLRGTVSTAALGGDGHWSVHRMAQYLRGTRRTPLP